MWESESVIVREDAHWNDGKCNAATNGWNYSVTISDSQAHDTAQNKPAGIEWIAMLLASNEATVYTIVYVTVWGVLGT